MSIEFQTGGLCQDPGRIPNFFVPQGWQCPACRVIHAPHIQACFCQPFPPTATVIVNWPPNTASVTPPPEVSESETK